MTGHSIVNSCTLTFNLLREQITVFEMASEKLLRIPKSGDPREFVLVNVIGAGKEDLDLNLVATEGESPYVLSGMW